MLGACVSAGLAVAQEADGPRQMEFPHVGLALSLPKDFQLMVLGEPYSVMNAVIVKNEKPVQAITLTAYPVSEKSTVEMIEKALMEQMSKNLAIRHLKVLKETPMSVAGLGGKAVLANYTFRGNETTAARVYFIRQGENPAFRVCYVLTVECPVENKSALLPALDKVIKSLLLTDIKHPSSFKIRQFAPIMFPHYKHGFAIGVPYGWFCTLSASGASLGQNDYLVGGIAIPSVNVIVQPTIREATSEDYALQCLERAIKNSADDKIQSEVLAQGPTVLSGVEAYQFVIRKTAVPTTQPSSEDSETNDPPVIMVQRIVCPQGPQTAGKSYSILLMTMGDEPAGAIEMMNKISERFVFLDMIKPPEVPKAEEIEEIEE